MVHDAERLQRYVLLVDMVHGTLADCKGEKMAKHVAKISKLGSRKRKPAKKTRQESILQGPVIRMLQDGRAQ